MSKFNTYNFSFILLYFEKGIFRINYSFVCTIASSSTTAIFTNNPIKLIFILLISFFNYYPLQGSEEGSAVIEVAPCTQDGKPLDEDYFVENPKELIGKPYHFMVRNFHL